MRSFLPSLPGSAKYPADLSSPCLSLAGANGFGWESILVKTGVFRGTDKSQAAHVPTMLVQDVLVRRIALLLRLPARKDSEADWPLFPSQEGVRWALEREGHGDVL